MDGCMRKFFVTFVGMIVFACIVGATGGIAEGRWIVLSVTGAIIVIVVLRAGTSPNRTRFRSPWDVVQYVMSRWEHVTEFEIGDFEKALSGRRDSQAYRKMLYALRIACMMSKYTKLATLDSRCSIANKAIADAASESRDARVVGRFLDEKFSERGIQLINDAMRLAEKTAASRKSAKAKQAVWIRFLDAIHPNLARNLPEEVGFYAKERHRDVHQAMKNIE
jgi:hypothetical protein